MFFTRCSSFSPRTSDSDPPTRSVNSAESSDNLDAISGPASNEYRITPSSDEMMNGERFPRASRNSARNFADCDT